jgi:hypothetical protein
MAIIRCLWCDQVYEADNDREHLESCAAQLNWPVALVREDGTIFLTHPRYPNVYFEKVAKLA